MEDFLNQLLFTINGTAITIGKVIAVCGIGILAFLFQSFVVKKSLAYYQQKGNLESGNSRRIEILALSCLLLIFLISAIDIFGLSFFYQNNQWILSTPNNK